MCVCSVLSNSLKQCGLQPARLLCPWNVPGKNTGVGCHFLLQEIFLSQGSNPNLLCPLHGWVDSLSLHHLGSLVTSYKELQAVYREYMLHTKRASFLFPSFLPVYLPCLLLLFFFPFLLSFFSPTDCSFSRRNELLRKWNIKKTLKLPHLFSVKWVHWAQAWISCQRQIILSSQFLYLCVMNHAFTSTELFKHKLKLKKADSHLQHPENHMLEKEALLLICSWTWSLAMLALIYVPLVYV